MFVIQNHPISSLKMMADFVGCMPVFPEFEYLDYNYFNSFLGQNVMQSHFSTGKKAMCLKMYP